MTPAEARSLLEDALRAVVPDASLEGMPGDTDLREELELDSLDFLTVVERLSIGAGVRIEEDEDLRTIDAVVGRLTGG
ncbi:acyl carrier protein [Ornithinimicrobium sediminis]|uniref:acyl carrier protein n=1 Tax=Ornithinimicrobium sediminis TaxID=2904603 RepID=UPI001E2F99A2|nr:acyl carrier protein [Ornithinimicrobium sediminis]MCE0488094.1 acyl carrier protein [Ornithinimicrobium sediminis]